jgi:hypothetical protein
MVVWKYRLTTDLPCVVEMPGGARPLYVGTQGNDLFVWALVNPGVTRKQGRRFFVYGTGHPIMTDSPYDPHYIGSTQMHVGPGVELVWHVFESAATWDGAH